MKKIKYLVVVAILVCLIGVCFVGCKDNARDGSEIVTDMIGREVSVTPGSYSRVVCIGAGALRMYSYVGDVSKLCGVEDIDNTTAQGRPAMFDGVARPYQIAFADTFNTLPSCGKGGPQAQAAEDELILACNPDIIISEYEDKTLADTLQSKIGVPVIVVKQGNSGVFDENFKNTVTLLGKIFNKAEKAIALNNFIASEKAAIQEKVKDVEVASQKKVYICGLGNWGTTNELMTATNYEPFNVAKINNIITEGAGVHAIEAEKFMDLAPNMDVVILDAAAVKNIKGNTERENRLKATKAWTDGEVYLEMAYNAYYTNLEIALINTWFAAKSVYPDLFADVDIDAKTAEITTAFLGKDLTAAIKAKPQSFGGYQKINTDTFFA